MYSFTYCVKQIFNITPLCKCLLFVVAQMEVCKQLLKSVLYELGDCMPMSRFANLHINNYIYTHTHTHIHIHKRTIKHCMGLHVQVCISQLLATYVCVNVCACLQFENNIRTDEILTILPNMGNCMARYRPPASPARTPEPHIT